MSSNLTGTSANDTFELYTTGIGVIDGGGGDYNQVDLNGKASDYTFKRNADGSVTISSAAIGSVILKDIDGFWFHGEAKWYGMDQLCSATAEPPVDNGGAGGITGTSGNDYLADTDGNDVIKGGDGNDTIYLGGKGNDTVDGEGGDYNQVDLDGKASDYTFTRNADGSIAVSSAAHGTDTLKNIDGFWFHGEGKWYSADQLATSGGSQPPVDNGGAGDITGTSGNDYLADTDGNDVIKGGDGNDTIYLGGKGNDTVDGEGGDYNQVDLDGKASDYTFTRNADGSIAVSSAAHGTDTLKNIDGFWLRGEGKWYSADQLATSGGSQPPVDPGTANRITGTAGADYLSDTDGKDVIKAGDGNDTIYLKGKGDDIVDGEGGSYNQVNLDGKASDYTFIRNDTGTITISSAATGTDLLKNIQGFWFNGEGKWYSADQLAGTGPSGSNPDAIDDQFQGLKDKPISGNVLANDQNLAGQNLKLAIFEQPANGTVTLNQDGTFTYVPKAGFTGDDKFQYEFTNAAGYKDCAVVDIKVNPPTETATASIGDRVWFDTNKNGLQDTSELGAAGVTVELKNAAGQVVATQQTDANGNYLFDKLTAGDYSVDFGGKQGYEFTQKDALGNNADGADSDADVTTGQTGTISLKDNEHIRTVDAGLVQKTVEPTASIGDRVWIDTNQNGLQDAGEQGASGVTVELKNAAGQVIATQQTDANGNYLFDKLAAGDYSVDFGGKEGYGFTAKDAYGNNADSVDSDADVTTGQTGTISLKDGDAIRTVDAGLVNLNKPPVAVDDNGTVECGDKDGIRIDVLANDKDPDGDALTTALKTGAANGTVTHNSDGTFSYVPKAGFSGTDSFTYTASDGKGGTSTATVKVEVEAPTEIHASIVGEDKLTEGGARGNYKIQLDQAAEHDTYYTIHVEDGTAKYVDGNTPNVNNQYFAYGTSTDAGPYGSRYFAGYDYIAATGPQSSTWDFSTYKGGQTTGRDIVVKVAAGQTTSDSFEVAAWKEKVSIYDGYWNPKGGAKPEGDENFTLKVTKIEGADQCEVITSTEKCVTICDTPDDKHHSPITFDLDGSGHIEVTGATSSIDKDPTAELGKTVQFDIDGDGKKDTIEWIKGTGDGLLVDTSKIGPNGEIDGKALFGDEGGKFANGYDKLKLLDADGNGSLTGKELGGLALWVDNGDAVLQAGELKSVADLGIASISTDMKTVLDAEGRSLMQSSATTADGQSIMTEDVWFGGLAGDLDEHQPSYAMDHHVDQHASF